MSRSGAARYAGGGEETTNCGSDGGSPVSSNVPSDSSSTPSDDVAHRDREVLVALRAARVARPGELRVGDRQEVGVVRVEEVRHARAVSLVGQLERALDRVALGLEAHAQAAEMHVRSIGHARGRAIGWLATVSEIDETMRPWLERIVQDTGPLDLYDAHTHIGRNDPDGYKQTPDELLDALEPGRRARRRVPDARAGRLRGGQRRGARRGRRARPAGSSRSAA